MSGFSLNGSTQPHFQDLHRRNESASPLVCYAPIMIPMVGVLTGHHLHYSFPLFLLQLILIVLATRATTILLRPFNQPRYVAEIISGLLLGPSVMGQIRGFHTLVFPLRRVVALETVATLGSSTSSSSSASRSTRHRCSARGSRSPLPRPAWWSPSPSVPSRASSSTRIKTEAAPSAFLTFLGVTLSITAFLVPTRTLAELKLLRANIGTTALFGCWDCFPSLNIFEEKI